MNRFFARTSLPQLLYSTVRSSSASSLSPPSSVLATPLHLRHFSNKSVEQLRHVWISGYDDDTKPTYRSMYIVVSEQYFGLRDDSDEDEDEDEIDNRYTRTYVTSYKNITLFDISYCVTFLEKISSDHVDFNVDVQLASRIFDSAIIVLSCLDGVKTESIIIDQQMTRFQLPRLIFIDDLDQKGADLWNIVDQVKSKLNHRCAAIQVPIRSIDDCYIGFVDLVKLKAYFFTSKSKPFDRPFDLVNKLKAYLFCSETSDYDNVPEEMKAFVLKKRRELIEIVSEVDDKIYEALHGGSQIPESYLDGAIRRATIARKFVPIIISDERYEGLKLFMEGVIRYLPSPIDVSNYAHDQNRNGEKVELFGSIDAPFVGKAFTYWHRPFLKLTYLRIYQGVIKKGDFITNVNTGKKIKIPRLFKRHDNTIKAVDEAHAGELVIVLKFDAILKSGDTFTDGSIRYTMTSADVPAYSVSKDSGEKFSNGVNGFIPEK
ncbi:putative translation protein, beta-barrel [Medicago truncatula]|uniref:Putative translation protein, beta-barrel n=2 Tax=Medicago truncatula TaxID=3880 RepID=G7J0I3_MEDTR|nr:translation elongation factor G, putative [Medicago truncatula]RHN65656.1 putative translation protein, beta-barrel [Medicago truncatula]